ncbi:MAG: DUF2390 domain-containing protein [Alphaproteobacteria bacterium]
MTTFKQYSLNTWKNQNNEQYLLSLQNDHNINVIFALWCGWKAHINSKSNNTDILGVKQTCQDFVNDFVMPLRTLRKSLTKGTDQYSMTLDKEIHKELELIAMLEATNNETGDINTLVEFKNITGFELDLG